MKHFVLHGGKMVDQFKTYTVSSGRKEGKKNMSFVNCLNSKSC